MRKKQTMADEELRVRLAQQKCCLLALLFFLVYLGGERVERSERNWYGGLWNRNFMMQ